MKREAFLRVAVLVAATAVAFLVAEAGLRLMAQQPPPPRTSPPEYAGLPELEHLFALAAPHQRGVYNGALHETNAFGLRSPATPRSKPPGRFRIVALGDSLVMGEGVEVGERYMDLAEAELMRKQRAAPAEVEVINIGLAGLDLSQSIARLEQIGLSFDPDLLIYGFTVNDLEGADYVRFVEVMRTARAREQPHPSRVVGLLRSRLRALLELFAPPVDSYVHELDHNYFSNPPAWSAFEARLDRLAEISRERGLCTVVLLHTHLFHLHRLHPLRRHYDAVARAAEARGLYVAPSLPWFEGEDPERLWIGPHDSHPNRLGHRLLAEALLAGLDQLPDACWQAHAGRASGSEAVVGQE